MSFDPVAYINEPRWGESRLGLERITELLDRLGNPQQAVRFVHVAGTNGKGSTSASIASILQEAGYQTGLFTSPYILEFADRIRINGSNISHDDLCAVTLEVKNSAEAMSDHPTEFELMTAVAFQYFAQKKCDIVVCEVGMGGRLDSTNVIEKPEVCIITSIGLDHTEILGDTLEKVAAEKAGIIKEKVPVVSWPQVPEVCQVFEQIAQEKHTSLTWADFSYLSLDASSACSNSSLDEPAAFLETELQERLSPLFTYRAYAQLRTGLLGKYQRFNAAVVIEAIEVLRQKGWNISDAALRDGLAKTFLPGRFEIIAQDPVTVIDGAHNPQGVQVLLDALQELFPHKHIVFIMGVLEDKHYSDMLEKVFAFGGTFITVTPPNPRALSATKLAWAFRAISGQSKRTCAACESVYAAKSIPDAFRYARKVAGHDGVICALGSLYSIASYKEAEEKVEAGQQE